MLRGRRRAEEQGRQVYALRQDDRGRAEGGGHRAGVHRHPAPPGHRPGPLRHPSAGRRPALRAGRPRPPGGLPGGAGPSALRFYPLQRHDPGGAGPGERHRQRPDPHGQQRQRGGDAHRGGQGAGGHRPVRRKVRRHRPGGGHRGGFLRRILRRHPPAQHRHGRGLPHQERVLRSQRRAPH